MNSLQYKGKSFNQREDGYVNVGQLCATHDKKLNDWTRLKSSNDYLEALSTNTQIPVMYQGDTKKQPKGEFLIEIYQSGTWAHPLVAIEVARWISPEFGVWCNLHIKTLIETGSCSISDKTLQLNPLMDKTLEIVKQSLEFSPLRGELKGQILLETAASINPLMKPHLEIAKQHLISGTATEDRLLTASEIGQHLGGISAQKVNKLLIDKGFQKKNPHKKSSKDASYIPTDRGSEFADYTQSASGAGSTFQQLRWYSSVMSQL